MLAAQLLRAQPGLVLLQDANNLLLAKPASLHRLSPQLENRLTSNRALFRGAGQAAALADMSPDKWRGARRLNYRGRINVDQMIRLSAPIGIYRSLELYFDTSIARSWILLPNQGPLFAGDKPVELMIDRSLPYMLSVRHYLEALPKGH
mgnify:FL=1